MLRPHRTAIFAALLLIACLGRGPAGVLAEEPAVDVTWKPLTWIEPGLVVEKDSPRGWSHVILVAETRVGSGDVDKAPSLATSIAQRFSVSITADVKSRQENGQTVYYIDRVGIGIGTRINGRNTIISSETQSQLGANLGFIERQVLSQSEKDFSSGAHMTARTPTMFIFDTPIQLLVSGEHRMMFARYVMLVSRTGGELGVLTWVMDAGTEQAYALPPDRPIQFLAIPVKEDRVLNVKADRFFLGIPSSDAFAQVRPTEGTPIKWTESLKQLGALKRFTPDTARQLEAELWKLWGK